MKIIKEDLILTENTTFNEDIKVEGDIKGPFNLKVIGNIDAWDIDARDIEAWNIICEKRIKKSKMAKTVCGIYIKNKSKIKIKNHK